MRAGYTVDQIHDLTKIDKWFLTETDEHHADFQGAARVGETITNRLHELAGTNCSIKRKRQGFSDFQVARAIGYEGDMEDGILYIRNHRKTCGYSFPL